MLAGLQFFEVFLGLMMGIGVVVLFVFLAVLFSAIRNYLKIGKILADVHRSSPTDGEAVDRTESKKK